MRYGKIERSLNGLKWNWFRYIPYSDIFITMDLHENIPVHIKRRIRSIDRVINNMLPNMYPCDYYSAEHFIVGLLEEIRWFLIDNEELRNINRESIENYIQEYKYDELTDYFNERCIVLKNDNLQENIRRILREEDFIPLESLYLDINDYDGGFDVFIMGGNKKIGEISFVEDYRPNEYTIVDATINDEYKGNRIYPKTIINLFKERPNIIINSVFRSPEAEKAWKYLLNDLPANIEKKIKHYKGEDTTLYQLKLRNIQESIRRVLREESLKDSLFDLINSVGIKKASKAVGGTKKLIKILDLNDEEINDFIYQYLTEGFYPDYNWGPELHDFYRKEIEQYGIYDFLINDAPAYAYLGEWDGYDYLYTLSITKWVINELTTIFGDKWIPVFKKWFEDNSGLEVREMDMKNIYNVL